jgi:casein kinase 1
MDYGDSDGVRFLVMERLGTNLLDLFRSTGCSFTNAKLAQYGEAMLDAVRECHSRKILYVDVKPDNFMLGLSGKNAGKVVIADFGVAEKFIDSKVILFSGALDAATSNDV